MRQTDRRTAEKVLNIVREVIDPSRMLQRVSIVTSEQKTVKSILMNLHPVQSMTAPVRTRTSLPSGAPAEHLTLGQMLSERRKIEDEKVRKEEEQAETPCRKRGKEGKEVYSEGGQQVTLMHISFS